MKRGYIPGFIGIMILFFITGSVALWTSFALLSGSLRLTFTVLGVICLVAGAAEFFLFLAIKRGKAQDIPKDVSPEEYLETWRRR